MAAFINLPLLMKWPGSSSAWRPNLNVHLQTLRYYERRLIRPRLREHSALPRRATLSAQQIKRLVDDLGVNLAGVQAILHLNEQVRDLQQENAALRAELARRAQPSRSRVAAQIRYPLRREPIMTIHSPGGDPTDCRPPDVDTLGGIQPAGGACPMAARTRPISLPP